MGYHRDGLLLRGASTEAGGHRERVTNTIFCKKEYTEELYKTGCQKLGTNIDVLGHMLFFLSSGRNVCWESFF